MEARESGWAWSCRSHKSLEQGSRFGAEKASEGGGDTSHVERQGAELAGGRPPGDRKALPGSSGADKITQGQAGPRHQLGQRGPLALWDLQDLCLQGNFLIGFLQFRTRVLLGWSLREQFSAVLRQDRLFGLSHCSVHLETEAGREEGLAILGVGLITVPFTLPTFPEIIQ